MDYELKKLYGLAHGTYAKMLAAQGGCCAICGTDATNGRRRLNVDHCHETKVVRGLLCGKCNTGIGQLNHSEVLLLSAARYLKNFPGVPG